MSDFDDLLDAGAESRAAKPEKTIVDVLIGETAVGLEISEVEPLAWGNITAANPARADSVIDRIYGYNFHGVAVMAAPLAAKRVAGDERVVVTDDQWAKLFGQMSPHDFGRFADAVWTINEYGPQKRLEAAKKASRVTPDSEK